MEKSLRKAAVTRITAPINTAPKLAMPARRAVSLSRSEPGCLRISAISPARNEYALKASASRRTKLPNSAMIELHFSRIAGRTQRPLGRGATFARDYVRLGKKYLQARETLTERNNRAVTADS